MTTFYCNFNDPEQKLQKWDKEIDGEAKNITVGDFLTIEYKRIKIVSKKFDLIGKSKVMVVNHVKSVQTKEKVMDTITYFDDDVKPKGVWNHRKKSFAIGPFDPSEYGNPVCYFTPGYQGGVVTITTKFWEIDDPAIITGTASALQSCLSLISSAPANPYGAYFEIADDVVGTSAKILTTFVKHTELSTEHIVEFRIDEGVPIYEGLYICTPEVDDINVRYEIVNEYFIDDDILVKKDGDRFVEYDKTYFVLRVSAAEREDLMDFDYMASSAELLDKLNKGSEDFMPSLLETTRGAFDMDLINDITNAYKEGDLQQVKALYNHLTGSRKEWFDESFPNIIDSI